MPSESQTQAIGEIISWLEQQLRLARDMQASTQAQLDELRRQVFILADQTDAAEKASRDVEPRLAPFKYLPDKLRELEEDAEKIRESVGANHAALETAIRILQSESEYDRSERGETYKRIEQALGQLTHLTSDVAQAQVQSAQASQSMQTVLERQREVEQKLEQALLRLDRVVEVNRDIEERIVREVHEEQDARFDVVFERLQVVGEMVKRNEDVITDVAAERSLREEVLQELAIWRQEHGRIDSRLDALEAITEKAVARLDQVHGEIVLLEGRHSGLGERVGGIRKDIAEVVDHVREEFAKYNKMLEKSRRREIQVLEQELREMKFHAFRPPEEP
ncbi:MAG: hypothetical protein ACSLFM_05375 [Tepidiformaceae bacterium]